MTLHRKRECAEWGLRQDEVGNTAVCLSYALWQGSRQLLMLLKTDGGELVMSLLA